MTVYLFHVVEEKTQKSLFFCKFEETFKEQSVTSRKIPSNKTQEASTELKEYILHESSWAHDIAGL